MTNKPTVLTARSHTDLLAAVPCILGFEPEESVVMLTFGAATRSFHARVDLPETPAEVAEVVTSMVSAAVRNEVLGVVLIVYTADRPAAVRVADALAFALTGQDITVGDMLLVEGDEYSPLWPDQRDRTVPQRFDARSHPFRAQAVMLGRVVHESRAELAATLASVPPPGLATAVARTTARADVQEAAETVWLRAVLLQLLRSGVAPTDDEAARILVDLGELDLLDEAVMTMDDEEPEDWVEVWTYLTRSAPDPLLGAPAALLAFAAWRAGKGALAWCAVDRCREVEPGHPLAGMVAELLERAVPPSAWTAAGRGEALRNRRQGP